MVDLGGDGLVLDAVVEAAHLTQRPLPLLDEVVDLRVAGRLGSLGLLLLFLLFLFLLCLAGHLVVLVREDGLAYHKGGNGDHRAQHIVHGLAQRQEEAEYQPNHTHQINGDRGAFYMFCHCTIPP